MKDARVGKLRSAAEKDLRISHCARTLLFRIFSDRYCDHYHTADSAFTLPWTQIATWCNLTSKNQCYAIVEQLRLYQYLFDEGVKGCPPTRAFKLNLKLKLEPLISGKGIIPPVDPRKSPRQARAARHFTALRAVAK